MVEPRYRDRDAYHDEEYWASTAKALRRHAEAFGVNPEDIGIEEVENASSEKEREKILRTRQRFYPSRLRGHSKKWPEEVAKFLARIGMPLRPRAGNTRDAKARLQLKELFANWKIGLRQLMNTKRGLSAEEAAEILLQELIEKNGERDRSKYNIFTFGSA